MDHTSFSERNRAEVLARTAAAAAHASYYAHPSLHFHSYLPKHHDQTQVLPPMPAEPVQEGMNEPYNGVSAGLPPPPSFDPTPAPSSQKDKHGEVKAGTGDPESEATEGTQEEEGGKKRAGKPSGLDKGAMEMGGEAGGTHTSPGPSAQDVEGYKIQQQQQQQQPQGGLQVPGQRPGLERFWSVQERMEPHLQLMCGPLLAYHTTIDGIWYGAAMVVTADAGSNFSSDPRLDLSFHTYQHPSESASSGVAYSLAAQQQLLDPVRLGSQKIFTYDSPTQGRFSFWRFMIQVPMQSVQVAVKYRLNGGAAMEFVVPARGQNFRWAAHSCNGFSSGVNPDDFKGDYQSGYDPVWEDMLLKHTQQPFHCMVGGGDQIYCDAITREPELQSWINAPNREKKINHPLTEEMRSAVDRFYFNHYCKIFRSNAFGRANSSIPMVNMLDDHDLIDGFGTYDDETQAAPVMSYIGGRGYFWFLLFQLFVCDAVDGTNPLPGTHPVKSLIIGGPGAWIPFPGHSLLVSLGPDVSMLAIDCRAERKLHRIVTEETYQKLFKEVRKHQGIKQLVILLGVPIAYPRMSFLEHFLDFKWNPLNVLARHNAFGLGGMVNKFNQASELLDDLNDHWCANVHKKERNWLVLECQKLALKLDARITFLSGDVHLAAVGCLFTKSRHGRKHAIAPEKDYRYMLNVVTSAIVNTPPPAGAAKMVATLAGNKHRTLHDMHTDEIMIPLFEKDTDGSSMKKKYVQPRRNYAAVEYLPSGDLLFDFRVESQPGKGETVSYPIKAPAPLWSADAGGPGPAPVSARMDATAHQMAKEEVQKAKAFETGPTHPPVDQQANGTFAHANGNGMAMANGNGAFVPQQVSARA